MVLFLFEFEVSQKRNDTQFESCVYLSGDWIFRVFLNVNLPTYKTSLTIVTARVVQRYTAQYARK